MVEEKDHRFEISDEEYKKIMGSDYIIDCEKRENYDDEPEFTE